VVTEQRHQFGAASNTELVEDRLGVIAKGMRRDVQARGDLVRTRPLTSSSVLLANCR
jgi:hypothetical protein